MNSISWSPLSHATYYIHIEGFGCSLIVINKTLVPDGSRACETHLHELTR